VTERRLVSILFADIVGYTSLSERRDPEDVREFLSSYFARCRSIIERYGGTIEKFIGDAVMAVWGTPVAQEDDAERAVRAALALTRAITALGEEIGMPELRIRAGVLTGTAAVDPGAVYEGMVHGDSVNTAARIQSIAAPGTVLVDDVTKRTTEAAIVYEDAGSHTVKGREQPVNTWTALRVVAGIGGARRGEGLEATLVGRDREMQQIVDTGESSVAESAAKLIAVTGEAGTGKSRLLWEYFKYVDGIEAGRWWHQGRCPSYGDGLAYWPLTEMIRGRAGIAEEEDPATARAKLEDTVETFVASERERGLVLPRLAHLLGIEQSAVSEPADLFSGWRLFFERMAETHPVVLVFEDVHWATGGMLDFIDYLLEWSAGLPIFIVCLGRSDIDRARAHWQHGVRLDALPPEAMALLLEDLVPGLPRELSQRIIERAEGVPLYAIETIRMLLDRGLLAADGARYSPTGDVKDLEIPETLQALAAARLDNLATSERRLLQDAAVLGTSFLPGALAAVSRRTGSDVHNTLQALVTKQVLGLSKDEREADHGHYRFLQTLLRTVALGTLSRRDRKARHLSAAAYLGTIPDPGGELAEITASHLLEAVVMDPEADDADEIRAEARRMLALAGEHTGSLALPDIARHHFEQAAALAHDDVERAKLLADAGVAASRLGQRDDARALLEEAIGALLHAGETAEAARTKALLADVLIAESRLDEAAQLMDDARESIADPRVLAELRARRGHVALLAGDYKRAYAEAEEALIIADPGRMLAVVANAQLTKAQTLFDQGRLIEAVALGELALQLGLDGDLATHALRAYNNLAYYQVQAGEPAKAAELINDGLRLARERGDRAWERDLTSQLVSVRVYRGEWDQALAEGEALREHDEDSAERAAWQTRPLILAARDDQVRLKQWLARELPASEWYEQSQDDAVARMAALYATGERVESLELAREVWNGIRSTGRASSDVAVYLTFLVDILLAHDGVAALATGLEVAEPPIPALRGQFCWLRGLLHFESAAHAEALAELESAVSELRPVENPYLLARALLDLGVCLGASGRADEAVAALNESRERYLSVGASPSVRRAEEHLADLTIVAGAVGAATVPGSVN
jgi:class 3 adenylate cyclase/predicted ATPase